jgi:hypothetical protein
MMTRKLPRRTVLRGMGTAMALPLLEAMGPVAALAAPARKAPLRMAFLFVPNGKHMEDWTPKTDGPGYELPYILEPLKNVKNDLMVLTGLTHDKARPNGDGPGDHARSTAAFLTGCQARKTAGADIKLGVSVDQIAAQHLGRQTRFPSLEIGCEGGRQAGNCDSGYSCAYSSAISWRAESTPVAKEINPRLVFERLFGNGDAEESAESRAVRDRYKKSILDFVLDDAKALKPQLGLHDQHKLEEYFAGVRELEQRLARADAGHELQLDGMKLPERPPSDYGEHLRLMADMLVLAFQADLTRVATFMLANDGSNRPYRQINVSEGHHDLSHHGRDPAKQAKIREINRFHVQHLAYLLEKLKSAKEGNGTLLDNCMLVYGAGISDGDRHNHDNLPVILAGRGGGTIKPGRHVVYPDNTPMANLFMSMLDRMRVPADHVGDSTGRLDHLT